MAVSTPFAPSPRSFVLALAVLAAACQTSERSRDPVQQLQAAGVGGPAHEENEQDWHRGPPVELAQTGPARYVSKLHRAFRSKRAMDLVRFIDGFYRAPANDGYEAVLARLEQELRAAGFGGDDARLQLEYLSVAGAAPAWTPRNAELVLLAPEGRARTLHAFRKASDVDRTMLPIHAPSCDVEGDVCLTLDDIQPGSILVTDVDARGVLTRAKARGACAVVSASLETFNVDPSGAERHLDAIQFVRLPSSTDLPVCQISLRTLREIQAACQPTGGPPARVRLRFRAEVERADRPLRILTATVVGAKRATEAVAVTW
jgi:hypothetical protein